MVAVTALGVDRNNGQGPEAACEAGKKGAASNWNYQKKTAEALAGAATGPLSKAGGHMARKGVKATNMHKAPAGSTRAKIAKAAGVENPEVSGFRANLGEEAPLEMRGMIDDMEIARVTPDEMMAQTGGDSLATLAPDGAGGSKLLMREGSGKSRGLATEEATHLVQGMREEAVGRIHRMVPDKKTWDGLPAPAKQDAKLMQLEVEIEAHNSMRAAGKLDAQAEVSLENLEIQYSQLRTTAPGDLENLSWWKPDELPYPRQKKPKKYSEEQWQARKDARGSYRKDIDDAEASGAKHTLEDGRVVPLADHLRHERYKAGRKALRDKDAPPPEPGKGPLDYDAWKESADRVKRNGKFGRAVEDETLGELGIQNNNYNTSYTVADGPGKGRPLRPEDVTTKEVGGELQHVLEDGTRVDVDPRPISLYRAPDKIPEPPEGLTPAQKLKDPRHDPKVRALAGREVQTRPDGISPTHVVDVKHVAPGGKLYDGDQLRLQRLMAFEDGKSQAIVMRTEPGTPPSNFPEPSGPLANKTGDVFMRGDDGYYGWILDEMSGSRSGQKLPDAAVAKKLGGSL